MNESTPPPTSSSSFVRRTGGTWPAGVWFAEQTDSTNAEALRHPAEEGLQAGTVFWALHQSAGRGRLGRRWEDVPGKALTFSLAFPRLTELEAVHWLHLAAGCAVVEVAEALRGGGAAGVTRLGLKWPNDVVEVDATAPAGYRKVAGILTEVQSEPGSAASGQQRAAVGVGINVNQRDADFPPQLRANATSLAALTGREFELHEVLERVLAEIGRRQHKMEAGDLDELRAELARRDVLQGATVEVHLPTGATLTGRAEGLDQRARLQLSTTANEHYHLESGEVVHLRPQ